MGKFLVNLLLWLLAIALSIFTASRTLDLLSQWLPAGQDIYSWLALCAFEGGFYFWSGFFALVADGAQQRGVALLMIVIDFLGIAVATIADLVLVGAKDGRLPAINPDGQQAIVVAVGAVIVLNVAAFLACKLLSPEKMRQWAVQEAEDMIHHEELQSIKRAAPKVAVLAAPHRTQQWVDQTWDKLLPGTIVPLAVAPEPQKQLPQPVVESLPQTAQVAQKGDEKLKEEPEREKKPGLFRRAMGAVGLGRKGEDLPVFESRQDLAENVLRGVRSADQGTANLDLIEKVLDTAPAQPAVQAVGVVEYRALEAAARRAAELERAGRGDEQARFAARCRDFDQARDFEGMAAFVAAEEAREAHQTAPTRPLRPFMASVAQQPRRRLQRRARRERKHRASAVARQS